MRTISRTASFKKDYKRESKGRHRATLDRDIRVVLEFLVSDVPLPSKYRDHALSGEWSDFRDCHVKPDLVLIYRKPDAAGLCLVRLGFHRELGF